MPDEGSTHGRGPAAHEGVFWRRAARWGSVHGPEWFVRWAPPVLGWIAAACIPDARRAVRKNLRHVRGERSIVTDTRDVLATFGTYAACLTDTLAVDHATRRPRAEVVLQHHLDEAVALGRGLVIVTAHTAGWDVVGPLFRERYGLDLMIVTHAEPDQAAGEVQDAARRQRGLGVVHVGDPLASLSLLHHVRAGGAVALQIDRPMASMRARTVEVLGVSRSIPEGPLRLAQLSGAPIIPLFAERAGHRDYRVHAYPSRQLGRRATEAERDEVAQHLARSMTSFLRAHPTQWLHFRAD